MAKEKLTVILDENKYVTCVLSGHNGTTSDSEIEIEYDMGNNKYIDVVQRKNKTYYYR